MFYRYVCGHVHNNERQRVFCSIYVCSQKPLNDDGICNCIIYVVRLEYNTTIKINRGIHKDITPVHTELKARVPTSAARAYIVFKIASCNFGRPERDFKSQARLPPDAADRFRFPSLQITKK